jgi:hypothetical protein
MCKAASYALSRHGETAHLRGPLFACSGPFAGPRLVVTGPEAAIRTLASACWELDGLEEIHGTLVLRPDTQDPVFDRPDAVLSLGEDDGERSLARVLARMAVLGMLPGRGGHARVA